MNQVSLTLMIGVSLFVLVVLKFLIDWFRTREKRVSKIEKTHSLKRLRESAIKRELEKALIENTSVKKKYKIELLCAQAGFKLGYGEYVLSCLFCAIAFPVMIIATLDNLTLAIVMIFVGWMIPGQFISFMRNRRVTILDRQIESFMELFSERYKTVRNPARSMQDCLSDFEGQEPIRYEIKSTLMDIELGMPVIQAMRGMAERTNSTYLGKLVEAVRVSEDIGTDEVRERLINKTLQCHRKRKTRFNTLKQRISGPKKESMILLIAVPGVMLYQVATTDSYIDFMLHTSLGKGGLTFIVVMCILAIWFINKKIGAPLE